jgi:hypothetical protein
MLREKSGRVSLVPEDIHDRQLYKFDRMRTDRDIYMNQWLQRITANMKTYENLTSLDP